MGDFVTQPHVSDSSSKMSRRIKNKKGFIKITDHSTAVHVRSLVFFSLPLFPLLLFFFFLLTFFFFLLADDGAVLVQAAICGPLDVSKQIAVDQLLAMRLQDMVGCPVIMRIGIDRIDSPSRRSGAPVLVSHIRFIN